MGEQIKTINRDQALEILKVAQEESDTEYAHIVADDALCWFLNSLGYRDVVEEYEKIKKWYA